jgi:D,D-heptose 1,7-bisphosphate phosphatase
MTVAPAPNQCVILVDDPTAAQRPSPDDWPFLAYHIWHARRFGFRRVLVLAAEAITGLEDLRWAAGLEVEVVVYAPSSGTAGALRRIADRLDERFLLLDGSVLFDGNWLDLGGPPDEGAMAQQGPGQADAGVYLLPRSVAAACPEQGSFSQHVLPALIADRRVVGHRLKGRLMRLGEAAPENLAASLRRGAVFFDRDGVLNVDHGYTHRWEDFDWIEGAVEAVKAVNDRGLFAFLITNQSGVARGYYEEAAIHVLHDQMQAALRARGAHVDDIRYCPHHPQGTLAQYTCDCDWRKPGAGMIKDLAARWPVDLSNSRLIGDKPSDLAAAAAAGISSTLFTGGRLDRVISDLLTNLTPPTAYS